MQEQGQNLQKSSLVQVPSHILDYARPHGERVPDMRVHDGVQISLPESCFLQLVQDLPLSCSSAKIPHFGCSNAGCRIQPDVSAATVSGKGELSSPEHEWAHVNPVWVQGSDNA